MTIAEKAAYLRGLTDGLGIDPQSKEGRLWAALNDLLGDMAHEIEGLHETDRGQAQALDGVADELSYLEELCGGFDSEDEDDDPACGVCSRPCMAGSLADEEEPAAYTAGPGHAPTEQDDELRKCAINDDPYQAAAAAAANAVDDDADDGELKYDGVVYDATCPVCGEEISFDEQTLERGSIRCPKCGEILEFDLGDDEEEDKPAEDAPKA